MRRAVLEGNPARPRAIAALGPVWAPVPIQTSAPRQEGLTLCPQPRAGGTGSTLHPSTTVPVFLPTHEQLSYQLGEMEI